MGSLFSSESSSTAWPSSSILTGLLATVVLVLLVLPADCFVLIKQPTHAAPDGGAAPFVAVPNKTRRWWYPKESSSAERVKDITFKKVDRHLLEEQSVDLAAALVKTRLQLLVRQQLDSPPPPQEGAQDDDDEDDYDHSDIHPLAKDRFRDLACTRHGERILESLFQMEALRQLEDNSPSSSSLSINDNVIRGAVVCLQSLCIAGTILGIQGRPEQIQKRFAHLNGNKKVPTAAPKKNDTDDVLPSQSSSSTWTDDDIRCLKRDKDREPGTALLATLKRKRTAKGAYQLLVDLKVWTKHENLDLLRSGARVRFSEREEQAAAQLLDATNVPIDVDDLMGLRQDLTHLKVYTIDDAAAAEVDDGISVEELPNGNRRVWIHIADADRWAPKGSELFEAARRRITSIYLPEGDIPMFPASVGTSVMSIQANRNSCALSLSVELNNEDGSVIENSIQMMPSTIRVSYRLTYLEVDEMFEEGSAYYEEKDLGILFDIAKQRWHYRYNRGSIESRIPRQIPTRTIRVSPDPQATDGILISINQDDIQKSDFEAMPKAKMVVTEAMILSGEALGRFAKSIAQADTKVTIEGHSISDGVRVPYRTQAIDMKARESDVKTNDALLEYNLGHGYCQAWFYRRFLNAVAISGDPAPHAGLGIDCYVQWSSPIRRFSDLQVHTAIKRYLRRAKASELLAQGATLPTEIQCNDLGLPHGAIKEGKLMCDVSKEDLDNDINYLDGGGIVKVARTVQNQTSNRWMIEYFQRLKDENPKRKFKAIVLGISGPRLDQNTIFIEELGFEHRMTALGANVGDDISLQIGQVSPEAGVLEFYQV